MMGEINVYSFNLKIYLKQKHFVQMPVIDTNLQ